MRCDALTGRAGVSGNHLIFYKPTGPGTDRIGHTRRYSEEILWAL
jgi:hypothetical protein